MFITDGNIRLIANHDFYLNLLFLRDFDRLHVCKQWSLMTVSVGLKSGSIKHEYFGNEKSWNARCRNSAVSLTHNSSE